MRYLVVAALSLAGTFALPAQDRSSVSGQRHRTLFSIDPFSDRVVGPRLELDRSIRAHFALVAGIDVALRDYRGWSQPLVRGASLGARYHLLGDPEFRGPFIGARLGYARAWPWKYATPRSAKTYRFAAGDIGYDLRPFSRLRIQPGLSFEVEDPNLSLHQHRWRMRPLLGIGITF